MELLCFCILLVVCSTAVVSNSMRNARLADSKDDENVMLIETDAQLPHNYIILAGRWNKRSSGTYKTVLNKLDHSLLEKKPVKYINDHESDKGDNYKVIQRLDSQINGITTQHESNIEDIDRHKRSVGLDTLSSETEHIHNCSLSVSPTSVATFEKRVVHEGATALILDLTFHDINVTASPGVILPSKWRWVSRETSQLLRMPYPATVWSLGLLSLHNGQPMEVELSYTNMTGNSSYCNRNAWIIGERLTNQIIGNALAQMTNVVAVGDPRYNTSHWCYINKIPESDPELAKDFAKSLVRTSPTLEYICCKYDYISKLQRRGVKCEERHGYDPVWRDSPFGLGVLMFLYFSMIFLKISGMIHKKIVESSRTADDVPDTNEQTLDTSQMSTKVKALRKRHDKVYLYGKSPITAMSIMSSKLSRLIPSKQSTKSRMAVFVYTLSTVLVPGIELLVYYFFLYDYVIDLAKNNDTIGFSAVLVGWKANKIKLSIFCGPYVALGLYFIIGWLLLLTKGLSSQLYDGVSHGYQNSKSILTISIEEKERLGSVKIQKEGNGYFSILCLQKCHIYMLVNPDFWFLVVQIYKSRWLTFLTIIEQRLYSRKIAIVVSVPLFPFYVAISITELAVAVFFYAIPLFSFFVCVIRGLTIGLTKYVSEKSCTNCSRVGNILRFPFGCFVFLSLVYYFFIFSVLFFDGFFFLSRILMFTYTAVVAYPKETYGYFMLVFTCAYFGLEGFIHFGDIYKHILKISIKLCRHDADLQCYLYHDTDDDGSEVYGIYGDMFEHLVEHIKPRRVQALHSFIKFVSMVFVLSVSIVLMERFKKFEDLSLLVHIFIVLFICALPAIYNSVISKEARKAKLKKKVKKTLQRWVAEKKSQRNGVVSVTIE